jgi:hypothetical protein
MSSPMVEITGLGRRAKAAIDRYKQDYNKLFDRRGFPRFPREEHDARVADLRTERNQELREIEERARELFAWAEGEAARAGEFPPLETLDGLANSYVQSHRDDVAEDIAGLSDRELAARLEQVLRDGPVGRKYLYYTQGKQRQRQILERQADAAREATGGRPGGTSQETMATPLDDALARLKDSVVGPEAQRRVERWGEIAREADKVVSLAFLARRDAESYAGAVAQNHSYRQFAELQQREPRTQNHAYPGGGPIADERVGQ